MFSHSGTSYWLGNCFSVLSLHMPLFTRAQGWGAQSFQTLVGDQGWNQCALKLAWTRKSRSEIQQSAAWLSSCKSTISEAQQMTKD